MSDHGPSLPSSGVGLSGWFIKSARVGDGGQCPLWVTSRHLTEFIQCPLYPQKQTSSLVGDRDQATKLYRGEVGHLAIVQPVAQFDDDLPATRNISVNVAQRCSRHEYVKATFTRRRTLSAGLVI